MKPLICVIDQSKVYRQIVSRCLQTLGYSNIICFNHPDDILHSEKRPDIIILDSYGEEHKLSGIEFFRLYGHTRFKQANFIFLTSDERQQTAISAMRMGAFDYILKSKTGLNRLVRKVDKLASSYNKSQRQLWTLRAALISLTGCLFLFFWAVIQYN